MKGVKKEKTRSPGYDTIGSAAAALGIDKKLLSLAKKKGAPGFRGSRVYTEELLPWLNENRHTLTPTNREALELEILATKLKDLQFDLDKKKGLHIEKAEIEPEILKFGERLRSALQSFSNEMASKCEGLRAAEIKAKLDDGIVRVIALVRYPL
jgi:hypothetical protein